MEHNDGFKQGFVAGLVAGAVGGALLYSKRKKIVREVWKLRAKADIARRVKNLKKLTRNAYDDIVDTVLDKYEEMEDIAADELEEWAQVLKDEWSDIKERFEGARQALVEED
ncbi:MAG TPA: hypothetical protein VM103_01580 [Candidatus Paceibacterota bacterium]|nr:hypothetical protein [Candidatus Paceibacterota bacterium]